jgi:dihydroxyacetone kinase
VFEEAEDTTAAAAALGRQAAAVLVRVRDVVVEYEEELGRLDAIAGDGDHGIGMRRGVDAAVAAAEQALEQEGGASPSRVLTAAGEAWSERAGGTSGALWGSAVIAAGLALGNRESYSAQDAAAAVSAFVNAITELGKAEPGDKTMVDALLPFRDTFLGELDGGASMGASLAAAAAAARTAADRTADLRPLKGRARPLAEKSLGHPDPGAVSFGLITERIAQHIKTEQTGPEPATSDEATTAGKGAQND